jgi:WD40 repeat protein
MYIKRNLVLLIFVSLTFTLYAQSTSDQIDWKQRAIDNEKMARQAEQMAVEQMKLRDGVLKTAVRFKLQLIAKEMLEKSVSVRDKELLALIGLQAYNFNKKNGGYLFDDKIYNGLLSALKKYGRLPKPLEGHTQPIMALSRNDSSVLSCGTDGSLIQWKKINNDWKGVSRLQGQNKVVVNCVATSIDGKLLARGVSKNEKHYVEILDLSKVDSKPKTIGGYESPIEKIIFPSNGNGFYSLSSSGQVIVYSDLKTSRQVTTSNEKLVSIDVSSDGTKIAGAGISGNLYFWNTVDYSSSVYRIFGKENSLVSVAFLPRGDQVVIGDLNGDLQIIDYNNGQTIRTLSGHTSSVHQIKFSHSGKFMATSGKDNTIRVWNLKEPNKLPRLIMENTWLSDITFSPDDTQILSNGDWPGNKMFPIKVYPLEMEEMVTTLCSLLTRSFMLTEWEYFVGTDVPYERTCEQ